MTAFAFAGSAGAAHGADPPDPQCTMNNQQATVCLTLTDRPDPVAYSNLDGTPTYISYRAIVENKSRSSSVSHVQLKEELPAGTTFERVTSTRGSCSAAGGAVTCAIGSLKKNQSATVEVIVTAPPASDPNAGEREIRNTATASFDERFSDTQDNGGRQDTVTTFETTTVQAFAGQTFVPDGATASVGTNPAQPQDGVVSVKQASQDVLVRDVSVVDVDNENPLAVPPPFCVLGQVSIEGGVHACRAGGWLNASVVLANNPGVPYQNNQQPLVFHLRWDESQSSSFETKESFVVFYQAAPRSPTQVFGDRCTKSTTFGGPTDPPACLFDIMSPEETGEGWQVKVKKPGNGRMR